MIEAFESNILSMSHRSIEFMKIIEKTCALLHSKLQIPSSYFIFFVSSATECWEIIGQSFIEFYTLHIYNGSFGEKWLQYRKKLMPNVSSSFFHYNRTLGKNRLPESPKIEVVCITQNETSNGTQLKNQVIKKIKKRFKQSLLCVDATSSMGGILLPWHVADIWFASTQKCFGLPSGMGIMICSEKSIEMAKKSDKRKHYNSLSFMSENALKNQTTHTPNMLGIFLLMKLMENRESIIKIDKHIKKRAIEWYTFLLKRNYTLLVDNKNPRSDTIISVKGNSEFIQKIKKEAKIQNIILGSGYGIWKEKTLRIANFPAISDDEIAQLKNFLEIHK